jgi:hypothetical protein
MNVRQVATLLKILSGAFLFVLNAGCMISEASLRNKSPLYRVYQKKKSKSLLMTPLGWIANLVILLMTGLIWSQVFQVLPRRG